jgi:hypothetical protein
MLRFVFNAQVAYFNIDEVLPEHFLFDLPTDSTLFNVTVRIQIEFFLFLISNATIE